jgi:hypothetical protein
LPKVEEGTLAKSLLMMFFLPFCLLTILWGGDGGGISIIKSCNERKEEIGKLQG